jgi:hypothetical protein
VTTSNNDRAVYRAVYPMTYPIALVPYVRLDGASVSTPVLDLSEEGLRYKLLPDEVLPETGAPIVGELRMHDEEPHPFRGHGVRAADGAVAIKLEAPGVPFSVLLKEQRAVLAWQRTRVEFD